MTKYFVTFPDVVITLVDNDNLNSKEILELAKFSAIEGIKHGFYTLQIQESGELCSLCGHLQDRHFEKYAECIGCSDDCDEFQN